MKTGILIICVILLEIFTLFYDVAYSQEQITDEFLKWPSESNYDFVIFAIVIMISLAVFANYLWGNRKGRSFSTE